MPNATFSADTSSNYANRARGWHFNSGTLDTASSMDLANFPADAAGQTPPVQNVMLCLPMTSLGTGVPSGGTITNWNASFADARTNGIMLIMRFLSTGTAAQIIAQCAAIKPVLWANRDVIAYVQCGMRCDFGEWADNCTDNNNVTDKTNILNAIIDMTPSDVPIEFTQVYPREQLYGTTPATFNDMKRGTLAGRLGFHSDCFLTGPTTNHGDSFFYTGPGTFTGFVATQSFAQQAAYVQASSAFIPFAGETCDNSQGASGVNGEIRTACGTSSVDAQGLAGGIQNEGPRYHLVHLSGSGGSHLPAWASGGCLDSTANLMGYRFQLGSVTHPTTATRGTTITVDIRMHNYGWARLFDHGRMRVLLVNGGTTVIGVASTQLRELPPQASGDTIVRVKVALPGGMATGTYAMHLDSPSPFASMSAVKFNIQFANANAGGASWDATNRRWTTGTNIVVS